jgi:hypothetical protein
MTPRDRLFELIMRRFDAMAAYRDGLRVVSREARRDGAALCASLGNLERLTAWLADAACGSSGGLRNLLARKALLLLYARVFSVWLDDTTTDRATTLAELDRRLAQLEDLAGWLSWRPGRRTGTAEPEAA